MSHVTGHREGENFPSSHTRSGGALRVPHSNLGYDEAYQIGIITKSFLLSNIW
jgi:hypothetical protein